MSTPLQQSWRRIRKNPGAMIGMVILLVMVFMAIAAPLITPFDPTTQFLEYSVQQPGFKGNVLKKTNPSNPDRPILIAIKEFAVRGDSVYYTDPAGEHYRFHKSLLAGSTEDEWHITPTFILGTDRFGRDLWTRLIYGMRVSLTVGVIAQTIALIVGVLLGSLAGYFRGWVDDCIMWLINVVWSFPTLLLVVAFSVILGKGYWQTFIAIGISSWVDIARIVRGQFFSIREAEYIEATRAFGYGSIRTIFRHMLPNAIGPVIVLATAGFATAIIAEASLSFIGMGVQPPMPSWGQMIKDGYGYIALGVKWGMTVFPAAAMAIAVIALNLFGDGLRDAFDPRTSQR